MHKPMREPVTTFVARGGDVDLVIAVLVRSEGRVGEGVRGAVHGGHVVVGHDGDGLGRRERVGGIREVARLGVAPSDPVLCQLQNKVSIRQDDVEEDRRRLLLLLLLLLMMMMMMMMMMMTMMISMMISMLVMSAGCYSLHTTTYPWGQRGHT
jgi:hypothetical protein